MPNELTLNQKLAQAISYFPNINSFALCPRSHGLYDWQHAWFDPTIRPLYSVKADLSVCNQPHFQLEYDSESLHIIKYDINEMGFLALELGKMTLS